MSAIGLLEGVRAGLPAELRERFIDAGARRVHLAVMREPYLSYLLDGEKTIESRFSVNRVDPYDRVEPGDLVLLKAGPVIGAFVVNGVEFRHLSRGDIADVRAEYGEQIMADDEFWELKQEARFASLLTVGELFWFPPFEVSKRDMRGWVVLGSADGLR